MRWLKASGIFLFCLVSMALLVLLLATLTDYKPDKPGKVESKGNEPGIEVSDTIFTILSWNIGYFGLGSNSDFFYDGGRMTRPSREDYDKYSGEGLKYLGSIKDADFYFFQEVDIGSRRSYFDDQVTKLRKVLSSMESSVAVNYKVPFVPVPFRNPMGKVKSGIMSFSSFQTIENTRYPFPGGYDWPVKLFMLDRCFLLSRLKLPGGKELVLINTHNEAFDNGSQRAQQIATLKDLMLKEYEIGNYVVTGGDWNLNPVGELPGTFSTGDISKRIKPSIETDFFPPGWKWVFDPGVPSNRDVDQIYTRGKTPTTIIDFFVVSPNISVEKVNTQDLGFKWCDHQPVIMTFKIK